MIALRRRIARTASWPSRRGSRLTRRRSTPRSRASSAGSTWRKASRGASSRSWCGGRARTSARCCARSTTRGVPRALPESGMVAHGRAGHVPVRARAPVADGRRRRSRAARSNPSSRPTWCGCRPAAARGLMRARAGGRRNASRRRSITTDGLTQAEAAGGRRSCARCSRARRPSPTGPVLDAFRDPLAGPAVLARVWWPHAERSSGARREIDVVGQALRRRRRSRRGRRPVRREAFVRQRSMPASTGPAIAAMDPRDVRRRARPDRARRRRHRARHGRSSRAPSRELPQPVAPGADVRPGGARAARSRSPTRNRAAPGGRTPAVPMMLGRARTPGRADRERDARRRRPSPRRGSSTSAACAWTPTPGGPVRRAGVRAGGRPPRGGGRSPTWTCRAARAPRRARRARSRSASTRAAGGSSATGPTPACRCTRRSASRTPSSRRSRTASCSTCSSDELGLGGPVGYHAWVGKTVHKIIEDCENGSVARSTRRDGRGRTNAGARRSSRPRPCRRRIASGSRRRMLPELVRRLRRARRDSASERGLRVRVSTARRSNGYIDRIGPTRCRAARITDYKTGRRTTRRRRPRRACSSASTTSPSQDGRGPRGGRRHHRRRARATSKGD